MYRRLTLAFLALAALILMTAHTGSAADSPPQLVAITHAPATFAPAGIDIRFNLTIAGALADDPPSVLLLAQEVAGGPRRAIPFGAPNLASGAYHLQMELDGQAPWALSFLVLNGPLVPGSDAHLQRYYFFRDFPGHPLGYAIYPTGGEPAALAGYTLPLIRR